MCCRENDNVVAKMSVELDESGGASRGRALDADESVDKQLERVLRSTVSSGHVGALSLDPKYFVFEAAPRKCFFEKRSCLSNNTNHACFGFVSFPTVKNLYCQQKFEGKEWSKTFDFPHKCIHSPP